MTFTLWSGEPQRVAPELIAGVRGGEDHGFSSFFLRRRIPEFTNSCTLVWLGAGRFRGAE